MNLLLSLLLLFPLALFAQPKSDEALKKLMEGNARYVADTPLHPEDSTVRREETLSKQTPFAIIIGCSDSRVPPELVFDQGLGDLFVVRVAGNVVGPIELDSVEFSADQFKVPLIMVLGHEKCGAVSTVMKGRPYSEDIANIAPLIEPAIQKSKKLPGDALTNAIQENVRLIVTQLTNNNVLKKFIKEKRLKIVGAYYSFEDGTVELL